MNKGIKIMFYLKSRHGNTGYNVMFHNKNGAGYGTNLDNLHVFSKEEAQRELNHDIDSLPLLKSEVDKLAIRAVDMQYLYVDKALISEDDLYVIQVTGKYNGNDIILPAIVVVVLLMTITKLKNTTTKRL